MGAPEAQLRLLVACGAAGGISATFNAPIAGVFFALELILRNFETRSFGMVVLSSVTADAIGRAAFGRGPFLHLPAFTFTAPSELVLYALLGVLASIVGLTFVRVLYGGEDVADRIWARLRWPEWLRPGVGGILLGLLLLAVPEMYGVGYPVLIKGVSGHYVLLALVGLMLAKILATSLTMWIGGSGGVFAPSLFIGAMLGSAYGDVAHALLPHVAHAGGAYGLVGMGAVFAAASRAPMTAVVIIFELTGDYQIILPLMFAIVVATGLSNKITRDNIYTLKLRRRGIDLDAPTPRLMAQIRVEQAMVSPPAALHPETSLDEIVDRFTSERLDSLPVVDGAGRLLGVVAAVDLERDISANGLEPEVARSLMREAPTVHAGDTLEDAVVALGATDDEGLPVLRESDDHLVGWLSHRDLLRAYRHRVGGGGDTGAPPHGGEPDPPAGDPAPDLERLPVVGRLPDA